MGRRGTGRALLQMEHGPCGGRAQLEEQVIAKGQHPAGGVRPIQESSGLTPPVSEWPALYNAHPPRTHHSGPLWFCLDCDAVIIGFNLSPQ